MQSNLPTITRLHSLVFAVVIVALGIGAALRLRPASVPLEEGWLHGATAKRFEQHYNAVFPVKTFGTNLWAALELELFGEGRPGVVIGREDWLFSREEFVLEADADRRIEAHLALIGWVQQQLAARGTWLIVAPIPAKARVEAAMLDAAQRQPGGLHAGLYGRMIAKFVEQQIAAPNLYLALETCKAESPVYLRTDTHWTPQGAACAARALADTARTQGMAKASGTQVYRTVLTDRSAPLTGDLFRFLPLDPYFAALLPPAETVSVQHTELDPTAEADRNLATAASRASVGGAASDTLSDALLGDAPAPETVLVGTSYSADRRWNFAGALTQALGEEVLSYAVEGKGPFVPMLDYLQDAQAQAHPARLLIWEIPERYLPAAADLASYPLPPALHAALRTQPLASAPGADKPDIQPDSQPAIQPEIPLDSQSAALPKTPPASPRRGDLGSQPSKQSPIPRGLKR